MPRKMLLVLELMRIGTVVSMLMLTLVVVRMQMQGQVLLLSLA